MSKHRVSAFAVSTANWMQYRPYKQFSPGYDGFYLRLANSVYKEINQPEGFARQLLTKEEVVDLAVVLTSWFEDYANETGLWAAFVEKNEELFGYKLPFYDLTDYDPEYINAEDLAYLCWHYCSKASGRVIAPDSPAFKYICAALADMFEEALDAAPGSDFYHTYLTLTPDMHFFEIKGRLHWMAFKNYLLGPEFNRKFQKTVREITEQGHNTDSSNKILYAMQDDYLFKTHSSFLAMRAPEWLAEVVDCPESLRVELRKPPQHIMGEFVFERTESPYYHFRHWQTQRDFLVREDSITMKGIKAGSIILTAIVLWQDEWYVSGMMAEVGNAAVEEKKRTQIDPGVIPFYAWPEDQQQELLARNREMERSFLEFFGDRLVLFQSDKDARAALTEANNWHNARISGEKPDDAARAEALRLCVPPEKSLDRGKGMALYVEADVAPMLSPGLARVAHFLTQPEPSDKNTSDWTFLEMFHELSPAIFFDLQQRYSLRNLKFPVRSNLSIEPYLPFFMRFFNPSGFRVKLPGATFLPS